MGRARPRPGAGPGQGPFFFKGTMLGAVYIVGSMYNFRIYVYLEDLCILVGFMYTCRIYVYLQDLCILVGFMYTLSLIHI